MRSLNPQLKYNGKHHCSVQKRTLLTRVNTCYWVHSGPCDWTTTLPLKKNRSQAAANIQGGPKLLSKPGLHRSKAANFWGWLFLCCGEGGCPVHHWMFSGTDSFFLTDASSTPSCDNLRSLQISPNARGEQNRSELRTTHPESPGCAL